eukprot:9056087-Pyramimonas_sp.AAC.1
MWAPPLGCVPKRVTAMIMTMTITMTMMLLLICDSTDGGDDGDEDGGHYLEGDADDGMMG